jgi:hypothetical protein
MNWKVFELEVIERRYLEEVLHDFEEMLHDFEEYFEALFSCPEWQQKHRQV